MYVYSMLAFSYPFFMFWKSNHPIESLEKSDISERSSMKLKKVMVPQYMSSEEQSVETEHGRRIENQPLFCISQTVCSA